MKQESYAGRNTLRYRFLTVTLAVLIKNSGYGIYTPPETGPSLAAYDEAFLKEEGAVSC